MTNVLVTIAAVVAVGLLYAVLPTFIRAHRQLRGMRIVHCPKTLRPTPIELDAGWSAFSTALGVQGSGFRAQGSGFRVTGHLSVRDCARWPAHRDCDQDCLRRVTSDMAQSHGLLIMRAAAPGAAGTNSARSDGA